MFSRLRKRFTYTNVAMTLALVFAMTGGAYAASKFVITSTKQIKPSVLKQLQGKAGKAGAAGANGAQGPQGSPGANGKDGAPGTNGTNGKDGAPGTNGISVTSAAVSTSSSTCNKLGGSEFTAAEGKKTTACNGKTGFTKTLPSGETETGAWSVSNLTAEPALYFVPISFNIPLEAGLDASHVHFLEAGTAATTECPGSVEQPKATGGNLCVYENVLAGPFAPFQVGSPDNGIRTPSLAEGAGVSGAVMWFGESDTGKFGMGSWAVTAE